MPTNEQKTLIFVVTFLSSFFLLLSFMPSQFYSQTNEEGVSYNVPEYFEAVDMQNYRYCHNFTIQCSTGWEYEFNLGGKNINFFVYSLDYDKFGFRTFDIFIDIFGIRLTHNWKGMDWYKKGIKVSEQPLGEWSYPTIDIEDVDANYDNVSKVSEFTVKHDRLTIKVFLAFNTTKYSKPSEAYHNNELSILVCMGFDQAETTINAWTLISQLLTFKIPNVHPLINALIAIPIWVAIAWLVTIFILKFIPFVGGG